MGDVWVLAFVTTLSSQRGAGLIVRPGLLLWKKSHISKLYGFKVEITQILQYSSNYLLYLTIFTYLSFWDQSQMTKTLEIHHSLGVLDSEK